MKELRTLHLVKDVSFEKVCRLREYAAVPPKGSNAELSSEEASRKNWENGGSGRGLVKTTPIKKTLHLVKDVAFKKSCKLHDYAAAGSKENPYRLASRETPGEMGEIDDGPIHAEVKVTPSIQDILNRIRPKQITGTIRVEGKEYQFGSGGRGQSIPYGDYLITPDAVGSWGSRHGAIGIANGTIADPKLHRDRDGIELHAATNSTLETDGCVAIRKDQWPEFRTQVRAMLRDNKNVYLHVSDQGASVSTNRFEFIGETLAEPTFSDVLSLFETPTGKAPD